MSCHVMSCRHYCINSKKSLSKTFSFHKIIYKYFAGFLACIYDIIRCHYEGNARDICGFQPADAPPLASNPICVDCHAFARNDNIFCDNNNFQFDKFQRLLSVIYKKIH